MVVEKSLSRQMAEFAVGLGFDDLPEDVVTSAKRFLYDSIGCAYGGMATRDVAVYLDLYREMGGREEATVIGFGDRLPAVNVTLLNSLLIRALDFNDIYWREDPSHPSDLIPAALALAEKVDATMEEVLVAIVLAYEFEQRLCELARPGLRERGWHHATLTQFVSPLVAGVVLGLGVEELVQAIGISGCHNHTPGAPTAGVLTMMKNTVDPLAVQSGVLAALLAKGGYTGPEAIFEGKEGLMEVMGPGWDSAVLTAGLGESWRIRDCSMKAFPTEALTHTHITATLKLVTENDIKPEEVAEVVVTTIARACDILFDPHKYAPTSRETADHSLPFCLARAILDRKITVDSFREENIHDPRLKDLLPRIRGQASQEFERLFPEKQPSRVTIRIRGGEEFSLYLEYPRGDPREPLSEADLEEKFNALTGSRIPPPRQVALKDLILGCEGHQARDFMARLSLESGPVSQSEV